MKLLLRLSVLAVMVFGTVIIQALGDREGLHLPWYLLHELILGAVPMAWLMWETLPKADRATSLGFLATSAAFIGLSGICELLAIQDRYWWFYQAEDKLSGLALGAIPIEEFLFYPLFLNLPVLFYVFLGEFVKTTPQPFSRLARRVFIAVAALLGLAGLALIVHAVRTTSPALDYELLPMKDAAGALRYSAGPADHGWTIVQALGLATAFLLLAFQGARVDRWRLALTLCIYFVFAFFVELMACGRGWWVWNEQQVIGVFTWIIPIDSYAMYITGAVLPVLVFEWVRSYFVPVRAEEPAAVAVGSGAS